MSRLFLYLLITALTSVVAAAYASTANVSPAKPQRIASLNLCVDALLLKLVEPERINSLTYLSGNSQFSPYAQQAQQFNLNHGLAEELVPRNPDLILAGDFGAADAKLLLTQLGFRVVTMPLPRSLGDITAHIRHFGQLTNSEVAAEKMAQTIEKNIARLNALKVDTAQNNAKMIPAFWYSSNGVVVGSDTLENELMTRAGFYNLALDKHINGFGQLDLEALILAQPQVIIIESADVEAFSLAREYVQHPALHNKKIHIIQLPATLSTCSAPVVADVIENLITQRQQLLKQQ